MGTRARVLIDWLAESAWPLGGELAFDATVVLAVALVVCVCLRKASAATRHRVWTLAVASVLALPLLRLAVPDAPLMLGRTTAAESPGSIDVPAGATEKDSPGPNVPGAHHAAPVAPIEVSETSLPASPPDHPPAVSGDVQIAAFPDRAAAGPSRSVGQRQTGPGSFAVPWQAVLVALWGAGTTGMLAAFAVSILRGRQLVQAAEEVVDPSWKTLRDEVADRLGLRRPIRMVSTPQTVIPLTAGWPRPAIVLPAECNRWSDPRRRAVLTHELSHVVRRDVFWQMVARLASAVYWFHPLVWLALRRLRIEREIACDDTVLLCGEQPSSYASHLVELASAISGRLRQPSTAVAMARNSMERRIRSILHPHLRRGPVGRAKGGLLAAGAAAILVMAASVSPMAAPPAAPDTSAEADAADAGPRGRQMVVRIVDEAGRPIVGAKLSARIDREHETGHSDPSGMVRLPLPEEDPDYLGMRATADGHVPMAAEWTGGGQWDPLPSEFALVLPQGTTIGGVVQDEQSLPIEDAEITLLLPAESVQGGRTMLGVYSQVVTTDPEGCWRSDQMPPGLGYLRIGLRHPDYVSDTSPTAEIPPVGQLRNQSAVMVMHEGRTVTGTVSDADGNPLDGAVVCVGHSLHPLACRTTETGQQGRFRIEHVEETPTHLWVFLAGWAPVQRDLTAGPGMEPAEIRLQRGRTVRARVVDQEGRPLRGVALHAGGGPPDDVAERFGLSMCTDQQGRWTWDWAPNADVRLEVNQEGFAYASATVPPGREEEIVLRLLPQRKVRISGRVRDGETGEPIGEFFTTENPGSSVHLSQRRGFRNPEGRYELAIDVPFPAGVDVLIEAEGYAPQQSRIDPQGQVEVTHDFELTRAAGYRGLVRLPDGQPAVGARAFVYTASSPLGLSNGGPHAQGPWHYSTTGPDGSFSLGPQPEPFGVFVIHEQGYAGAWEEELEDAAEITLRRWARLEGTLRIAGQPAADHTVGLDYSSLADLPPRGSLRVDSWEHRATTDAEGRFAFERCLAGSGTVSSTVVAYSPERHSTTLLSTHATPVELASGKTSSVSVGGFGRPVVGRVVVPEDDDRETGFTAAAITARRPQSDYPFPPELREPPAGLSEATERIAEMGDTPERRALSQQWNDWSRRRSAWLAQWRQSEEGKASMARFVGIVDADGRFRIEDVPAGVLELTMTVYPPRKQERLSQPPNRYERIGDVRHQFTVPEMPGGRSDQPLDLGEIEVILNDELKPGDRAPDFEVGMLSGETIRLSDLRGKYVVLDFQSGVPPTSTTAYFNALYRQYAGHPQFAFIGLAMGEHVDAIREVLSQQEIPWAQGVLEAESKVIADYDLDGIPQTLLIAPDGTVLRRGIGSGELERELQSRLGRSD